jgi:hypothetical protein
MASVTLETNRELQLTTFIVRGGVSRVEIEKAIASFYHEGASQNVLWDLREASLQELSTADIQDIVQFLRKNDYVRPKGRTAMVAPKDVDYGLVRMGEAYANGLPTAFRVFRSLQEAQTWLQQGLGD